MHDSYLIIISGHPVRFDRSAIMRAAWKGYRDAVRRRWVAAGKMDGARMSYELGMVWALAKSELRRHLEAEAKAAMPAPKPIPTVYRDPARAEVIKSQLMVIEYSDAWSLPLDAKRRDLQAELEALIVHPIREAA